MPGRAVRIDLHVALLRQHRSAADGGLGAGARMAVRSGAALCGNRSVRARLVVRVGDAMAHIGHVDQDLCPAVVRERICGLAVAYAAACADGCTAIIETVCIDTLHKRPDATC